MKVSVGLIGCGYWGKNLARCFQNAPNSELVCCCDLDKEKTAKIASVDVSDFQRYTCPDEFIESLSLWRHTGNPTAVVIATPIDTHYMMVRKALEAGHHVFVEKPLSTDLEQAKELVAIAKEASLRLCVGHVFLYHPAVVYIRELMKSLRRSSLDYGPLLYFESQRQHLGGFHGGSNVLWDLAPHDISIMVDLLGACGLYVEDVLCASGIDNIVEGTMNTVHTDLMFLGKEHRGGLAHIALNWLSATKIRKTVLAFAKKTIVYDDMDVFARVKIYNASVNITTDFLGDHSIYHQGDVHIPALPSKEPLLEECTDFIQSIRYDQEPYSSGERALEVIDLIEAIETELSMMTLR